MDLSDRWILDVCCMRRNEDDAPEFCEDVLDMDVCLIEYGKCEFLRMDMVDGAIVELEDD